MARRVPVRAAESLWRGVPQLAISSAYIGRHRPTVRSVACIPQQAHVETVRGPGGSREAGRRGGVGGRDPAGGSVTVCRARQGCRCLPPGNLNGRDPQRACEAATCRHSTLPTQAKLLDGRAEDDPPRRQRRSAKRSSCARERAAGVDRTQLAHRIPQTDQQAVASSHRPLPIGRGAVEPTPRLCSLHTSP